MEKAQSKMCMEYNYSYKIYAKKTPQIGVALRLRVFFFSFKMLKYILSVRPYAKHFQIISFFLLFYMFQILFRIGGKNRFN